MLENRDIVVFGDDWGRHPSTLQHLIKFYSAKNRIFWFGSLGHRKPSFNFRDISRVLEKIKYALIKGKKRSPVEENSPVIINPLVFPFHDSKILNEVNHNILKFTIKHLIAKYEIKNPLIFTSTPLVVEVLDYFMPSSINYICQDDYSAIYRAFKRLSETENILLEKAMTTFSISQILVETRLPKNGKSYYFSQGIDEKHFDRNKIKTLEIMENIKKPIIGFFGFISNDWVDINLVYKCAQRYPDYSFVFIGKIEMSINTLKDCKNVYTLGFIPYAELPYYANYFKVGFIPFHISPLTLACNPIKLFEYFSLGLPVVTVDLPEVRKFSDITYIAENSDEFIELLGEAVNEEDSNKQQKRIKIAKSHSWEKNARTIEDIIYKLEGHKNN